MHHKFVALYRERLVGDIDQLRERRRLLQIELAGIEKALAALVKQFQKRYALPDTTPIGVAPVGSAQRGGGAGGALGDQ